MTVVCALYVFKENVFVQQALSRVPTGKTAFVHVSKMLNANRIKFVEKLIEMVKVAIASQTIISLWKMDNIFARLIKEFSAQRMETNGIVERIRFVWRLTRVVAKLVILTLQLIKAIAKLFNALQMSIANELGAIPSVTIPAVFARKEPI